MNMWNYVFVAFYPPPFLPFFILSPTLNYEIVSTLQSYSSHVVTRRSNKAWTGPRSAARFKPEVYPGSKLTKCPEQEQQQE